MELLSLSKQHFLYCNEDIKEVYIICDEKKIIFTNSGTNTLVEYDYKVVDDIIELYNGDVFISSIERYNGSTLLYKEYEGKKIIFCGLLF